MIVMQTALTLFFEADRFGVGLVCEEELCRRAAGAPGLHSDAEDWTTDFFFSMTLL